MHFWLLLLMTPTLVSSLSTGSCDGYCGGQSKDRCFCDSSCIEYRDCCPDYEQLCIPKPDSCNGYCGGRSEDGCYCDAICTQLNDCCPDYEQLCLTKKEVCTPDHCSGNGNCYINDNGKAVCKCKKGYGDKKCSSKKCTKLGRVCIPPAKCYKKRCVCPQKGCGLFECADHEDLLCIIKCDPHVESFGNSNANVHWPCRYRVARLTTEVKRKNGVKNVVGPDFCFIEILAVNKISQNGKYYVSAVEIAVSVNTGSEEALSAQDQIVKYDFLQDGIAGNVNTGVRYTVGTGAHPTFKNVTINCEHDPVQNFAFLSIPECNKLVVKFRPYNPDEEPGPQSLAPGLSVRIADAKFKLPFAKYPNSLCGTDSDDENLYYEADLSPSQNVLYALLLQLQVDQEKTLVKNKNFTVYEILAKPQECTASKNLFAYCGPETQQKKAVVICGSILIGKKTTKCLKDDSIFAFRLCLQAYCQPANAEASCAQIQILFNSHGCKIPSEVVDLCDFS